MPQRRAEQGVPITYATNRLDAGPAAAFDIDPIPIIFVWWQKPQGSACKDEKFRLKTTVQNPGAESRLPLFQLCLPLVGHEAFTSEPSRSTQRAAKVQKEPIAVDP